jgi:hypothetical protein
MARTRKPGQDSQDRTAGKSQDGTGRTRKRGQDDQNRTEGQGSWERKTEMGHRDRTAMTVKLGHGDQTTGTGQQRQGGLDQSA